MDEIDSLSAVSFWTKFYKILAHFVFENS